MKGFLQRFHAVYDEAAHVVLWAGICAGLVGFWMTDGKDVRAAFAVVGAIVVAGAALAAFTALTGGGVRTPGRESRDPGGWTDSGDGP